MNARLLALTSSCLACLVATGCGLERHAAESEFIQLSSTCDSLSSRIERFRPDLAPLWEYRMSSLERELNHAPPGRTLGHIRALRDSLRALQQDLEYAEIQEEREWAALRETVPEMLARLAGDPDAAVRRAERRLRAQWDRAMQDHESGHLAAAVAAGSRVRTSAIPLTAGER